MSIFNLFKCRHKRTYFKQIFEEDGGYVLYKCCKCHLVVRTRKIYEKGRESEWILRDGKIEVTSHDHKEETFKGEDIAKLRHQGMLLEKVPKKYIPDEIDRMFAGCNWAKVGDYL